MEINPSMPSPPYPDFHGFVSETAIPAQLIIQTEGDGNDEIVIRVVRKKVTGRPRGCKTENELRTLNILESSRTPPTVYHSEGHQDNDHNISKKILALWHEWNDLERTSRRPDRASKP